MLNTFPSLFDPFQSTFYIPMLLRIVVAIYFVYIVQHLIRNRALFENTKFILVGKPKSWLVYFTAGIILIVAFLLFVGLETQWAAIFGILIAFKQIFVSWKYPATRFFSTSTYILLIVICATLLVSGAGAMAFDLPL